MKGSDDPARDYQYLNQCDCGSIALRIEILCNASLTSTFRHRWFYHNDPSIQFFFI